MKEHSALACPALLVDDEGPFRRLLAKALRVRGHLVTICGDPETAWAAFLETGHPLVLVSLGLDRGSGADLCLRIRGSEDGKETVMVGLAPRQSPIPLEALFDTIDDCLVKAAKPDVIAVRLAVANRLVLERGARRHLVSDHHRERELTQTSRGDDPSVAPTPHAPNAQLKNAEPPVEAGLEPGIRSSIPHTGATALGRAPSAETPSALWMPPQPAGGGTDRGEPASPPVPSQAAAQAPEISCTDSGGSAPGVPSVGSGIWPGSPIPTPHSLPEPSDRGIADGWWDWDLASNKVVFSSQWKLMLGYDADELGGGVDEWFDRVHPEDLGQLRAAIAAHLSGRVSHLENEHRLRLRDGSYGCMFCRAMAFRDSTATPFRVVGSHRDITELKNRDPLTGLPNRGFLIERLGHALEQAGKEGSRLFAVLFLDLDRFKNVNYSLGHRVGDQLLKAVAGRLRACVRSQESPSRSGTAVAHVGGDEFAVLLEGLSEMSEVTRVAKRILEELQTPFSVDGHEIFTTASIGIAQGSTAYERPEDILRDADTAMSRAKAQGKASYAVFDIAMHTGAVSLLKLETDLRRAVKREEFLVYYQPIVRLDTGRIAGFEALVRWQHPDGALLLPNEFMPVAEETGLIVEIDRWVLRSVCRQLRLWNQQLRDDTQFAVSVNVSGVQFLRPDMIVEIDRTLRTYGLYGRSLKLEITESVIMEHARYAADLLHQLKALDVKLSIDDFGTGYSSLSYLRRFEIDTLKIDYSFINRIDSDQESWEIVRTIVTLGNNLGKEVVAEGIERGKQRELLLALRCGYGQGLLFSKPVPAEGATAMLAAESRGQTLLKA